MVQSTSLLFLSIASLLLSASALPLLNLPGIGQKFNLSTPLGIAPGIQISATAAKFGVRYATAQRWASPQVVNSWTPGALSLPFPACPQPGAQNTSEDCLFMVIHVPTSVLLNPSTKVPTMMWIHGGSFKAGSASDPGLDGSKLAAASNCIVAVVQYRLGVLGFLPPSGLNSNTNLAVQDITAALQFLKKAVPALNGDPAKVTLAGQSSGAHMIRALLSAPAANPLWRAGILHSDPMDFGFLPTTAQTKLQNSYFANSKLGCSATDTACLKSAPISKIIDAQDDLYDVAPTLDGSIGQGEPLRPLRDGTTISTGLTDDTFPTSVGPPRPLLITTVANEAGPLIGSMFPPNAPSEYFDVALNTELDSARANTIISSSYYDVPSTGDDATRVTLDTFVTDYSWRCASWSFARTWLNHGGQVWTGQFVQGATYAGNENVDYCVTAGRVCHQDDIYILFGTTPSPTSAQNTLTTEIQARWSKFIRDLNPNPSGYASWSQSSSSSLNTLKLGGSGQADPGVCGQAGFWGGSVQYDYQLYGQ